MPRSDLAANITCDSLLTGRNEPTSWGGSTCAGSRGYYVEVFRHRGIGLAAVLGNPSIDSWHIATLESPPGILSVSARTTAVAVAQALRC